MDSTPAPSLACSRRGALERVSCITGKGDGASGVVIGRRLRTVDRSANGLARVS